MQQSYRDSWHYNLRLLSTVIQRSLALEPRADIPNALAIFPSGPLNEFLRIISTLPEGATALDAGGLVLTPLQQVLADAVCINTTRDELAQNASCADVTVIFTRGTTEPGNGVEFPATFTGFNLNSTEGVPSMASFINQAITSCPDSKILVPGHSQGALVVRSTTDSLPADTMSKINSVVTFGDPKNQTAITGAESKILVICHENDAVCSGGFITVDHLTYADNATTAAQFVVEKAGGE
ncbi:carbohydrate esterase family 5 protein [Lentithecium fluviatile CBS 122367]|uniref:cutinase n=1 Tax=Lentithecium fluviatile CBS 122367 TaxID=1168545 RepID=A0A6G1J287_9PLEO|nr:carbohydrate esterase family 5 protein [Lentithecium fluviatile CBS 122367]